MKEIVSILFGACLSFMAVSASVSEVENIYIKPSDIEKGCARFYLSDPIKNPGTKTFEVCATKSIGGTKFTIGSGVFSEIKDKFGKKAVNSISYISTGPLTWVTIWTRAGLKGDEYEILPETDADLSVIRAYDHTLGLQSFNDNIESGSVRTLERSQDPDLTESGDAVDSFTFQGRQKAKGLCAYFYGANPVDFPLTRGFAVCLKSTRFAWAKITNKWLRSQGLDPKSFSSGISYVEAGFSVDVTLYKGKVVDGDSKLIRSHEKVDLEPKETDWNDQTLSVYLEYTKPDERSESPILMEMGSSSKKSEHYLRHGK